MRSSTPQTARLDRSPRPRDHRPARPDRTQGLRADRPCLRRHPPRHRRARHHHRQGPQAADHPLTQETAGPPCVAGGTWQPTRRAAVSDQHRHAADPQSARPADRQARHPRRRALPVADRQDDPRRTSCATRRDAAATRRRRHHRDRAVARTRTSRNHADVLARRPRAQRASAGSHQTTDSKPGRYRPPDALLRFLDAL